MCVQFSCSCMPLVKCFQAQMCLSQHLSWCSRASIHKYQRYCWSHDSCSCLSFLGGLLGAVSPAPTAEGATPAPGLFGGLVGALTPVPTAEGATPAPGLLGGLAGALTPAPTTEGATPTPQLAGALTPEPTTTAATLVPASSLGLLGTLIPEPTAAATTAAPELLSGLVGALTPEPTAEGATPAPGLLGGLVVALTPAPTVEGPTPAPGLPVAFPLAESATTAPPGGLLGEETAFSSDFMLLCAVRLCCQSGVNNRGSRLCYRCSDPCPDTSTTSLSGRHTSTGSHHSLGHFR